MPSFALVVSFSIATSPSQGKKERGDSGAILQYPQRHAENCDFENREEAIIRDNFITKRLDDDIQRELLRDIVELERALSIAVNMEMRHQNQQRISSKKNSINAIQQFTQFRRAITGGQ